MIVKKEVTSFGHCLKTENKYDCAHLQTIYLLGKHSKVHMAPRCNVKCEVIHENVSANDYKNK